MSEDRKLSDDEKEKIKKEFEKIDDVTKEKAKATLEEAGSFFEKMKGNIPNQLKELWNDILMMYEILREWYNGDYKASWNVIAKIVFALAYLINPIDVIPDIILFFGFLDDATVIGWVLSIIRDEVEEYKKYKKSKEV